MTAPTLRITPPDSALSRREPGTVSHLPFLFSEEQAVKEAFRVLGGLVALTIIGSSALAAPTGAVATPDGRTTIAASGAAVMPRHLQTPQGGKVIVNTFNADSENAYNCCSGWTISAEGSPPGRQDVAMPFTPSKNYAVKTITVAVGYVT